MKITIFALALSQHVCFPKGSFLSYLLPLLLFFFFPAPSLTFARELKQTPVTQNLFVEVTLNVNGDGATCNDWYSGPVNNYLDALASLGATARPSSTCRQTANTIREVTIVGPEPGANLLSDDPRKVPEGAAEFRTNSETNLVTLIVSFLWGPSDEAAQNGLYVLLNDQFRNGTFLNGTADAEYPLLKANVYKQVLTGVL